MRRSIWLVSVVPFATWIAVQGCGGENINSLDGGAVDGTTSVDSGGADTAVEDSTVMDTGAQDGAGSDTGSDTGVDTGLAYLCIDGGTVSDCAQCQGRPRPCVNCMLDGGSLVAYCVTQQTSCFPPNNAPYQRCPCGDAGNCPQSWQVCHDVGLGLACRTCGETNTLNDVCKGGGMCRIDGGCN